MFRICYNYNQLWNFTLILFTSFGLIFVYLVCAFGAVIRLNCSLSMSCPCLLFQCKSKYCDLPVECKVCGECDSFLTSSCELFFS